jgi:hypothetical protein
MTDGTSRPIGSRLPVRSEFEEQQLYSIVSAFVIPPDDRIMRLRDGSSSAFTEPLAPMNDSFVGSSFVPE